jgi:hypothetical protein
MEDLHLSPTFPISCANTTTHRTSRPSGLLLKDSVSSKGKPAHLASTSNLKYFYHHAPNITIDHLPLRDSIPTDGKISMSL